MSEKQAKFHLSLRVEPDIARYIEGIREDGQPLSKVYNRVLREGMRAMENTGEHAQDNSGELIAALRAHVDTLTAQLDVKDAQIKNLGDNLKAAQTLHMQTAQHKPIEAAEWPTGSRENAQETRQAAEWVNTPEEPAQPAQPTYTASSFTTQPKRGGLFGTIGRAIFGSR